MDEYPDPEEEYEMMYADELEIVRDVEEADFDVEAAEAEAATIPPSVKKSLNFDTPKAVKTTAATAASSSPQSFAGHTNETAAPNGVLGVTQVDETSNAEPPSRKRPVMDEFDDDIAQFLNDDFAENRNKRHKPLVPIVQLPTMHDPRIDLVAREADLALIEQIVDIRKNRCLNEFLPTVPTTDSDVRRIDHVSRIHRRLPDGDFQAVTMDSGERFYLNKIDEEELDRQIASTSATQKTTCLLNVPYLRLKAQAEKEQIRQDRCRAERMQAEDSGMESGYEDENNDDKVSL